MKMNNPIYAITVSWIRTSILTFTCVALLFAGCRKNTNESLDSLTNNRIKGAASTSAAIGSGWVDITAVEESEQRIQLENWNDPSLNNISTRWFGRGTRPYYMENDFDTTSTFNSNVTAGYVYSPSSLTHTHTLYKFPGNRSEIRIQDNYSTGTRQFEGYVTINDKMFGSAVFQLFGSTSGATQMQIRGDSRTDGGRLYINYDSSKPHSSNSTTIATGANNQEFRINVIHLQNTSGNRIYIYVNGVEKFWFEDGESPSAGNYMKYGCYGRENESSTRDITGTQVKWRNVRYWKDGTRTTTSTSRATVYQNCSYGGWNVALGVGEYTLSQLQSLGFVNDDASSIRVPSGLRVTVYTDNNFSGSSTSFTSDVSCLSSTYNDRISSIRITNN
jgi:hypothetical protein